VDLGERGSRRPGPALGLDGVGDLAQVARRADNHPHRHLDPEQLGKQGGKRQRRQGIPTQVGELGVGIHIGARRSQHRACGPDHGVEHRLLGGRLAQRAERVHLRGGQLGVELLQPRTP